MMTTQLSMSDGKVKKERRRSALESHNNKHGFRGIFWEAERGKFRAEICPDGKRKRLGRFATAKDAAVAYDIAAIEAYGYDAALNFPMPGERATTYRFHRCSHMDQDIYISPSGKRQCRPCNLEAVNRYQDRLKNDGYRKAHRGGWIKP